MLGNFHLSGAFLCPHRTGDGTGPARVLLPHRHRLGRLAGLHPGAAVRALSTSSPRT
ncbi:MAG: hypothetical protein MZV64_19850 [Ignavibacteriales bacterium]|nr:hypothetical protein [Ignavibacteriales bacterium]